jgi:hypothetical protein
VVDEERGGEEPAKEAWQHLKRDLDLTSLILMGETGCAARRLL